MRHFFFLLLVFMAVIFVFLSFSELENIASTLEKSNWIFLSICPAFRVHLVL